jgi:hypothetical protein
MEPLKTIKPPFYIQLPARFPIPQDWYVVEPPNFAKTLFVYIFSGRSMKLSYFNSSIRDGISV